MSRFVLLVVHYKDPAHNTTPSYTKKRDVPQSSFHFKKERNPNFRGRSARLHRSFVVAFPIMQRGDAFESFPFRNTTAAAAEKDVLRLTWWGGDKRVLRGNGWLKLRRQAGLLKRRKSFPFDAESPPNTLRGG